MVYPVDKWVLMMMLAATGSQNVRNLGDVRWCATGGSQGKGAGRHIACFVLLPQNAARSADAGRKRTHSMTTETATRC